MVIDNAQVLYAEIMQLGQVARQHKLNYEFWEMAHHALEEEKAQFHDSLYDRFDYWRRHRYILKRMKNNKREYERLKEHIENLKWRYRKLTGKEKHDDGWE